MIVLDKKLIISIFVLSLVMFFTNLNYGVGNASIILFWISSLGMIGSVIYQIIYLEKKDYILVLFEIITLNICLHLTFQVGFSGLNSRDSYDDLKFLEYILANNFFSLNQDPGISGWPALHVLSASLIQATGLDQFQFVKYFASFFTSLIVIFLYLLTNAIYKNKKVSLLAPLIFITIPKFMIFESFFIREVMGLFAIIAGFYLVYTSKNNKDIKLTIITIIFFVLIVLSHHFSSFMFLILLFLFYATSMIIPYIYKHPLINNHLFKSKTSVSRKINVQTIFTIALVILMAYWLYCSIEIWANIGKFFANLITLGELPSYSTNTGVTGTVVTLKGKIVFYGFFIYTLLFSIILLLKLRIDDGKTRIEDSTFTLFLFFCGGYGLLSVYAFTSLISPDRLLTHGWLFGIIPMVGFLLTLKKYSPIYKKIFFALLISFMIFNLFNIQQEYLTKDFNHLGIASDKEYALADTLIIPSSNINSNNPLIYDKLFYSYEGSRNAFYDEQNTLGLDTSSLGKNKSVTKNKVMVINELLLLKDINIIKIKNPGTYQKTMNLLLLEESTDKVADLGNGTYVLFSTK